MHSKILFLTALLATLSLAQTNNYNINTAAETKVIADVENHLSTLASSPTLQTDVAAILSVLPSSFVALASASPEALLESPESSDDFPDYVSAISTSVIASLETLAAKPIQAVEDVSDYIEQLAAEPEVSAAITAFVTAVPTSVRNAFESDPVSFLENVVTETGLPNWASDIPAPLQSEIGAVVIGGLSIIAADLEATDKATVASSGFLPKATGGAGSSNTTKPTTGPATPLVGRAAPLRSVGAGVVALVGAVGFLVWL